MARRKLLPPHPPPPADLHHRDLPLRARDQGWIRSYNLVHDPLYVGQAGTERFDSPDGAHGVCYAGVDDACAFVETFGRPTGHRIVTITALLARGRAELAPLTPLLMVDLTGPGLAQLGADNSLCSGNDYAVSQAWSAALWAHPRQPDGLLYRARHDPELESVALFDRAGPRLTVRRLGGWYDRDYRVRLAAILKRYGYGLVNDRTP